MAVVPGLNIGVGLLVLIILWVATALACIAMAAIPKARYGVPVLLLLSLVITLVLLFYPREGSGQSTGPPQEEVDGTYFGRLVLLIVLGVCLVGGAVAVAAFYLLEPIHAGRKRTLYITS